MKESGLFALGVFAACGLVQALIVFTLVKFNSAPEEIGEFWNWLYLTNQRTVNSICIGF